MKAFDSDKRQLIRSERPQVIVLDPEKEPAKEEQAEDVWKTRRFYLIVLLWGLGLIAFRILTAPASDDCFKFELFK
jgi:hypothetical protein